MNVTICTYNLTNKCYNYLWHSTYSCCFYVTMAINVLNNKCNMCICDLPDMYTAAYISDKSIMPMLQSSVKYVLLLVYMYISLRDSTKNHNALVHYVKQLLFIKMYEPNIAFRLGFIYFNCLLKLLQIF